MKKIVTAGSLILVVLLGIIGMTGCGKITAAEAERYVQANLDLIFQGELKEAREFIEASDGDLRTIHDNGIQAFVEMYIMDNQGESTGSERYMDMVDDVFQAMKYRIEKTKETKSGTYEVLVEYRPVTLFEIFTEKLKEETNKIVEAEKNGEYQGTDEEKQYSMLMDYMIHSYELFEESYLSMEYEEMEEFTFTVKKGSEGKPVMDEEEINSFIRKIMKIEK